MTMSLLVIFCRCYKLLQIDIIVDLISLYFRILFLPRISCAKVWDSNLVDMQCRRKYFYLVYFHNTTVSRSASMMVPFITDAVMVMINKHTQPHAGKTFE